MKLYKITNAKIGGWETFFGTPQNPIEREGFTRIAQTPNCDAFLLLSEDTHTHESLELQNSVPSGFDFTYCQEWGLEVTQDKIDRVTAELS